MLTKKNLLLINTILLASFSVTACKAPESGYSKPANTMSSVLYNLTQSEYGKVDAKKLTIDKGNLQNETIYRATGSGNANQQLLKNKKGYVIGNTLFAERSNTYQSSDFESVVFKTDAIIEVLKDKQSGNNVEVSTKLNSLNLSGYQPYKPNNNYIDTIFSDWQGKTTNNKAPGWVANVQFPQGSQCYQKAQITTNKDLFIIDSEDDKTIAKDLTGLKLLIAKLDAERGDLEVSGTFSDVVVGSNNQLLATYSPSKRTYIHNGKVNNIYFNLGGVIVGNTAYEAILYNAGKSLSRKTHTQCDFYNKIAAEYIFSQFKQHAR